MPEERTISIELTPTNVLHLLCILSVLELKADPKMLFEDIAESMQTQLCNKSTVEELEEAKNNASDFLKFGFFPEIIK